MAADNIVVGTLRALLTADTAQFEEGMRKGSNAAKKFGDDTSEVGKQLDKAFDVAKIVGGLAAFTAAIVGVTKEMQGWLQSTSEQEDATARLSAALRAQGTFAPAVVEQYDALATAYEKTTVFSDELLMGMESLLVQVGGVMPKDMKAALGAVTDLAAGLRIDLNTATMLVAKALEGNVGALHRYGINVDEAALKTQGATAVFDAIAEKMGGQAAAQANTFSGQLQRLGNIVDNVKETLGGFIAAALKPLIDIFIEIPEPLRTTIVMAGLLGTAAVATAVAIGGLTAATATLLPLLGVGLPAAAGASTVAVTALTAASGLLAGAIGLILTPVGLAVAAFAVITGGLLYLKNAITTDVTPAIDQATAAMEAMNEAARKSGQVKVPLDPNDLRAVKAAEDALTESAKASIKAHEEAAKAAEKQAAALKVLLDAQLGLNRAWGGEALDNLREITSSIWAVGMHRGNGLVDEFITLAHESELLNGALATMNDELDDLGRSINFGQAIQAANAELDALADGFRRAGHEASGFSAGAHGMFDGIQSGFQHLVDGMTGKNGVAGFMNNLGKGIVDGFGNILSGGLASVIQMGVNLAIEGIAKIGKLIGGLFQSEETKKVNKPRDQFFEQFGGFDGLAEQLTASLADQGVTEAGNTASGLISALNDADTEDKFKAAERAIADVFKAGGKQIQVFHGGGIVGGLDGLSEVMVRALPGEGVLNRSATASLGKAGVDALNAGRVPNGSRLDAELSATLRQMLRTQRDLPRMIGRQLADALAGV